MALIQWQDSYSVGVAQMDEQHKKWIDIINRLHDAMSTGAASKVINEIIQEMNDYTVFHFSSEEKLLAQHGYPGTMAQEQAHKQFVEKLEEIKKRSEVSTIGLSTNVMASLKDWLLHHILEKDKLYTTYLNNKGVH